MSTTFTVYFDGAMWIGILELSDSDGVRAARHVFGSEPTGPQLLAFARKDFGRLWDEAAAAPPVDPAARRAPTAGNPKRLARAAARAQREQPVGTAAQRALAASYSERVADNRAAAKRRKADESAERRRIARAKAKARHRGR